jgi:pantoate--beta-alanine ligase
MIIFKKAAGLTRYVLQQKKNGRQTGFVPTMGALHSGHLSLIEESKRNNDLTVCSIFINPTQFNNPEDLEHYPVTLEKDLLQLLEAGCDVLFLPPVAEIYPDDWKKKVYDLGPLEGVLEGFYRPGHFQGVCQVVDRLFSIVHPDQVYFGQKDFQQCMVIRKLLSLTRKDEIIRMHIIPTLRETDGLAMSSRNLRLENGQRQKAVTLFRVLSGIRSGYRNRNFDMLKKNAKAELENEGFQVDYIEIANTTDLTPATNINGPLVALVAATIGKVRLIDSMMLN